MEEEFLQTIQPLIYHGGTIIGNISAQCGGGIYINSSNLSIENSKIEKNKGTFGGGIYVAKDSCNMKLNNVQIDYNKATKRKRWRSIRLWKYYNFRR